MAVGKARIAPFINDEFQVTGEFGTWRETRYHVGIDLATSEPKNLYSIGDGYIFRNWWNDARGWAVIVKMDSGIAFEYQHMQSQCSLVEGTRVTNGQFIGIEGTTGQITGLHLHMEMQDLSSGRDWDYTATLSSYMNPADYMRN